MFYCIGAVFLLQLYRNQGAHSFSLNAILQFVVSHYISVISPKYTLTEKTKVM